MFMNIKDKIIESTFKLLVTEGYNVGINKIADKAGVSKGGLYHHFRNKDELFEVVIKKYVFNYFNDLSDIVTGSGNFISKIYKIIENILLPFKEIEKYISKTKNTGYLSIFSVIRQNKNLCTIQDNFNKTWNASINSIVKQGINEGYLNLETDIIGFTSILRLLIDGTLISAFNIPLDEAKTKLEYAVHAALIH